MKIFSGCWNQMSSSGVEDDMVWWGWAAEQLEERRVLPDNVISSPRRKSGTSQAVQAPILLRRKALPCQGTANHSKYPEIQAGDKTPSQLWLRPLLSLQVLDLKWTWHLTRGKAMDFDYPRLLEKPPHPKTQFLHKMWISFCQQTIQCMETHDVKDEAFQQHVKNFLLFSFEKWRIRGGFCSLKVEKVSKAPKVHFLPAIWYSATLPHCEHSACSRKVEQNNGL